MLVDDQKFLNTPFVTITWCFEDLRCAFESEGIEWNDENVSKFAFKSRSIETFKDRETEEGWDILQTLVWDLFR